MQKASFPPYLARNRHFGYKNLHFPLITDALVFLCHWGDNLQHQTTCRSDSVVGESSFCRFLENDTPTLQKSISKRAFFKPYWTSFSARRKFSTHFLITFSIWKTVLRIQGIFWYNLEYHTTLNNDSAAA